MFRKIISALLLLITLTSFIPATSARTDTPTNFIPVASANTGAADNQCITREQTMEAMAKFVGANILWGGAIGLSLLGLDKLTSFIETKKIAGFAVGGVIEPLEQTIDFLRHTWLRSLIWGLIASIFNLFAGWLINDGLALNLALSANNPLISYGGAIILQIANFGLVISIIFVGIATILRLEQDKFSADKLLIKLITGIVLVNLTIPIVTAIADLGTKITMAMYHGADPCPENITLRFTVWELYSKLQNPFGILTNRAPDQQPTDIPRLASVGNDLRSLYNNQAGHTPLAPAHLTMNPLPTGTATPPAGTAAPPARAPALPAGTAAPPARAPALPAGTAAPPAKAPALPDGTATPPAGTAAPPARAPALPAGTATHPAGTATHPAGTATHPAGTATPPAGTAAPPAGTATHPAGTATPPARAPALPDGTATPDADTQRREREAAERREREAAERIEQLNRDKEASEERVGPLETNFNNIIKDLVMSFLALIVAGVISFIAALTFFVFAIFLLLRYVILMLLITFSPLIWFGFIFSDFKMPSLGNIWSGWWSHFLKWVFFGPIIILFLAFVATYLHSITNDPVAAPQGVELVQIGQLIAIIIIAAMGIYIASKFSGIAGSMVMSAASGGLGYVASKTQSALKKGQVSAQMRAEQLREQGLTDQARAHTARAKLLGGVMLGNRETQLLGYMGVRPNIKTQTDQEARQQIIERRAQTLSYRPEEVLNFDNEDLNKLPAKERRAVARAAYKLRQQYIADPTTLQPKQVAALDKLEKILAPNLASLKMQNIQTDPNTGAISDAEAIKVLSLTKAEMDNISPDDKAKAVAAVYSAQNQYARDPTVFQSQQVVALRAFDKLYAPNLASLKMQNIQTDPNTGAISDAEAIKVLSLTKAEMDNISPDDKAKAVAAVYSAQSQYARDPTVFQSPQVVALRAFEKLYPSELIGPTMRDVEAPSGSVIGAQLSADELNRVRPILRLTNESASEIVRNGTSETIEKSIQAILAITNETQVNSKAFTRAELGRSQSLQRIFSEKIINYTLDNLDPLTNPESVLHLSNNQLFQIGRSFGTQTDKQNIERALEILNERKHLMNDKQLAELNRVSARVHVLKKTKQEW